MNLMIRFLLLLSHGDKAKPAINSIVAPNMFGVEWQPSKTK